MVKRRHHAKYSRADLGLQCNIKLLLPWLPPLIFSPFYRCNEDEPIHGRDSLSLTGFPSHLLSLHFFATFYRSLGPIRLLWLRESHSEDTTAHLIWAQIDSSVPLWRAVDCERVYAMKNVIVCIWMRTAWTETELEWLRVVRHRPVNAGSNTITKLYNNTYL